MLIALGIVLRRVKQNDVPFGGVVVIGAREHYQNEPIREMPPLPK